MEWETEFTKADGKKDGFTGQRMVVLPIETFSGDIGNPLVRRLYLTDVGFFPKAENHYREREKGAEEYIFFYCTEGKGSIYVNDRRYLLREREAFCIPANQKHRYFADRENPWSILWVHMKGEDLRYYPLEECKIVKFESVYATNRMMFLFDLLFRVLDRNYTLGNFIYISQVLGLILAETYMREKTHDKMGQNRHVTEIIKYMSEHMEENLTLEELSEKFQLSKSYISAAFTKYTQHSPIDFLIKMKMGEACKLLKNSDIYVYEVAQRVGFADQYYFSRVFKKEVGISPKEYKENNIVFYEQGFKSEKCSEGRNSERKA